jgi:hypothetical protein
MSEKLHIETRIKKKRKQGVKTEKIQRGKEREVPEMKR